nr:hypothetical protein [Escherichia coli]
MYSAHIDAASLSLTNQAELTAAFRKVPMPLRFDTGWRISLTETAGG